MDSNVELTVVAAVTTVLIHIGLAFRTGKDDNGADDEKSSR
jgi:hypothetical protein